MPRLSAFLIVKNEERDLPGCLESLAPFVQEIVIVDGHSTDRTREIAQCFGAKVFTRVLDGFGAQKQFALDQTTGDWAFSIDADERVSPKLGAEIDRVIQKAGSDCTGYEVKRHFHFLGQRMRFGGVGSDWVLRLFQRARGHFTPARVHERILVVGKVGRLRQPMSHYSYATVQEYVEKCNQYTTLAAQEQWMSGRRFSWRDHFRPAWELGVRVLMRGAWLDGHAGLTYAALSAHAAWLRAVKLKEIEKNSLTRTPSADGRGENSKAFPLLVGEGGRRPGEASRILIVRTDRLGDVLLTTPVSRRLREKFPGAHLAWLVRPYTAPLLEQNPDIDQVIVDKGGPVSQLIQRLKQEHFDSAIVAYPRWRAVWAVWRAAIPQRIGPASKWYSVLFNHRIWQHRSEGKKHEADYNIELLAPLGVPFQRVETRFVLTAEEKNWARRFLESNRISFQKPVVCLHPGSGGSSERWPLSHFMELGDRLQEAGCDVIVTGGPGEDYQNIMIDQMRRIPVFVAAGSVSIRQLASILSCANLVVSNSTGPLHIAVALNVPTVSLYSPIPTCHPKRWGPYPAYAEGLALHSVFMPPLTGVSFEEMTAIGVDTVMECCRKKLGLLRKVPVA